MILQIKASYTINHINYIILYIFYHSIYIAYYRSSSLRDRMRSVVRLKRIMTRTMLFIRLIWKSFAFRYFPLFLRAVTSCLILTKHRPLSSSNVQRRGALSLVKRNRTTTSLMSCFTLVDNLVNLLNREGGQGEFWGIFYY